MVGIVLQRNATEQEGDNAGHGQAIGEEVAGVCGEGDQAGLDAWVLRQRRVFEYKGHGQTEHHAQRHGHTEREQEDADTMEDRRYVYLASMEL